MFKSMSDADVFLDGLMAFLFTAVCDAKGFHGRLLGVARTHCTKGVKAVEYGIVGEVRSITSRVISFI